MSIQPIVHQISSLGLLPSCTTTTEQVENTIRVTTIYSLQQQTITIYKYPPFRVCQIPGLCRAHYNPEAACCLLEVRLLFFLVGKALLAHSSVPGPRGGGVEAKASDGATQPEVAAVLVFSASWRYSSRLTGSAGLASKGLKKRAT